MNRRTFLATSAATLALTHPALARQKQKSPRTSKRLEEFISPGRISKDTKPQGYSLVCYNRFPGEDSNLPALIGDVLLMHKYHHARSFILDNLPAPSLTYLSAGEACPLNLQGTLKGIEKRLGKEDTYFLTIICPTKKGKSRVTGKEEIALDFGPYGFTGVRHLEQSLEKTKPKQGIVFLKTNHDTEITQRLRDNKKINWETHLLLHEKPKAQKPKEASPTLQFFLKLRDKIESYSQENRYPKIHQALSGLPIIDHTSGNLADFSLASFLKE